MVAEDVCRRAADLITDARARYGEPQATHARIAAFWSAYLDHPITAHDVALMMVLLSVACPTRGASYLHTYLEVVAHAGIAAELADCV